jgi:hypothetical protein
MKRYVGKDALDGFAPTSTEAQRLLVHHATDRITRGILSRSVDDPDNLSPVRRSTSKGTRARDHRAHGRRAAAARPQHPARAPAQVTPTRTAEQHAARIAQLYLAQRRLTRRLDQYVTAWTAR